DTAEVGRALRNLMINAIRHTPSDSAVEVVGDQDSGMAVVTVSDACGGIPAGDLPRVFDVAFRGEIAVRNAGRGCQFVIRLPLASAAPEPADRGQLAQVGRLRI